MRPDRRPRRLHRIVQRSAASLPMARFYGIIQPPLDRLVYRLSHGRASATSWLAGLPIILLTTTGARTGLPRTTPLLGLPDGQEFILIASTYGRPGHPAWYYNLRADQHATIVVDGRRHEVVAYELHGAERERDYRRGEEVFAGFTRYRRWAADRTIPVLRLRPDVTTPRDAGTAGRPS